MSTTTATTTPKIKLVSFGEAMVRFAPYETLAFAPQPQMPAHSPDCGVFLRSIGGDEMNVCVDTSVLNGGVHSSLPRPIWISVLPEGPLGDYVCKNCESSGLDTSHILRVPNSEIGIFTVIPEKSTVHYQRRHSAFAELDPYSIPWDEVLANKDEPKWLHMTGITPMISLKTRLAWLRGLEVAYKHGVPVSIDFNHRKQLGSLEELWTAVCPQLQLIELLILSVASLKDLAVMEKVTVPESSAEDPSEICIVTWGRLMAELRSKWNLKRLVVCFKSRDERGVQTRWSVLSDVNGLHSTRLLPVYHVVKDECGGGSAWAAAFIDSVTQFGLTDKVPTSSQDIFEEVNEENVVRALRHCDLLAAMCQEAVGDHSIVTRMQLASVEKEFEGRPVFLHCTPAHSLCIKNNPEATLVRLKSAGIIAILRAKNAQAALERGKELIDMGCRAIEVTIDSDGWEQVLSELVRYAPRHVCIGVGTVMDDTVCLLPKIAQLGAQFALSPINPLGFISTCHTLGLLAVPSGFSSNELWDLHRQGARMIKLFHAGLVGPSTLKSMLSVTPLKVLNIAPSGGVSHDNVAEWLRAGAVVVGMGTNLVGQDVNCTAGTEEFAKERENWVKKGKPAAQQLLDTIASMFPTKSASPDIH